MEEWGERERFPQCDNLEIKRVWQVGTVGKLTERRVLYQSVTLHRISFPGKNVKRSTEIEIQREIMI